MTLFYSFNQLILQSISCCWFFMQKSAGTMYKPSPTLYLTDKDESMILWVPSLRSHISVSSFLNFEFIYQTILSSKTNLLSSEKPPMTMVSSPDVIDPWRPRRFWSFPKRDHTLFLNWAITFDGDEHESSTQPPITNDALSVDATE